MATVNGTSGSDTLNGTSGNDTLNGLGGNDTLVGSGGTDFYDGGAGFDTLDFRSAAVGLVVNFATGTVNGEFSGSFASMERLLSGDGADSITGAAGGQNLSGRTGNDTLAGGAGIDTLYSGIGTDHFVFRETGSANADLVQDFESGVDKIRLDASVMTALGPIGNFSASDGRFVANSTGTAQDAGDRVLYNTTTRQIFYDADGNGSGAKVLIATLQSGATLIATDIIVQDASGASGRTINGTSGNDSLVGGPTNDTINGFDGEDTINGGAGADSMVGGADADTYFVDDVNDVIVEQENGGFDTANASVSYTLPAWVEDLTLTGAAFEGTGNELPNVVTGTDVRNDLDGGGGDDTVVGLAGDDSLSGGDGSDLLDGGTGNDNLYGGIDFSSDTLIGGDGDDRLNGDHGADSLDGGLGNDHYVLDEEDVLTDAGGIDSISIGGSDWTIPAGIENAHVIFGGTVAIFGNELNNSIFGYFGHDRLEGRAGNDFLDGGGGGDDTLLGGEGNDIILGRDGLDILDGGVGNDSLDGGVHQDTVYGGTGVDALTGGAGADAFLFDQPTAAHADHVADFQPSEDKVVLDGIGLSAVGPSGNFEAGDARFWAATGAVSGHDADDRIVYNTLTGDLYYDADGDGATAAQRIATLQGAPALSATDIGVINGSSTGLNIVGTDGDDSLTGTSGNDTIDGLGGNDTINGNSGADSLIGSDGDDSLDGGLGADTMDGGLHDDIFIVDSVGDVVIELEGGGANDEVRTSVSYSLPTWVDNLTLTGTASIYGSGNELDNIIAGNAAANTLYGGQGNDTISGEAGGDWLYGHGGDDVLRGGSGDDQLIGDDGNDFIDGGDGLDALYGEAGNDTLVGGAGDDYIFVLHAPGDYGNDAIDGGAGIEYIVFGPYAESAVVVDLAAGTMTGGGPSGQGSATLTNVERVQATPFADRLTGGGGDDVLIGMDGNDTLTGAGGSNSLGGGRGADLMTGGDGNDTMHGDGGSPTYGDGAADTMIGGLGNDLYYASTEDLISDSGGIDGVVVQESWILADDFENLHFASGDFIGIGNSKNNWIAAGTGAQLLDGRAGNDTVTGGEGNDTLLGGDGNDILSAGFGFDRLEGGVGNDTLAGLYDGNILAFAHSGAANADLIREFAAGSNQIELDGSTFTAIGPSGSFAAGDARFFAGAGANSGRDASDRVAYNTSTGQLWYDADGNGTGAAQLVATLEGAPSLAATDITIINGSGGGGGGGSTINGTAGADTLTGTAGDDTLNGLGGNDMLVGSGGSDFYDGGANFDTLNFTGTTTGLVVSFAAGTVSGGFNGTFVNIERLMASDAADSLTGAAGSQNISGRGGSDTIAGAAGNDTLYGGTAADSFVFREMGTANADRVSDFASGADKLALDDAAFTSVGAMGNFAAGDARFWSSSTGTAHDANDRVIFNTSSGSLYYDADGSGAGAAQLIATVQSGATVAATDIVVI